ncbi:hypothetical protein Ndes2526B_g07983 [Nannochloris sp. 'desiccata']|nr:putative Peptidyl-prolyl cis-trans isomerase pin1 [Chlorella desiccata (nom. nud.)]
MATFKIPEWAAEPRQAASLQAIDGSDTQDVGRQSHYVFGRDLAESTILIDDPCVSRRHGALVHHKDGRIYIIDLASRTGVSIDGTRIPPNKPTKLKNGSRITIGPRTYVLNCEVAPGAPTTAITPHKMPLSQVRASHLLVKHRDVRNPRSWKEPEVTRSQEEALAMIKAFEEQLITGQADFAALASVESHCSSAKRGGDLGVFGHGQMMKAFEDAAFALEVGQMSGPVFTDSGVHLIFRTG